MKLLMLVAIAALGLFPSPCRADDTAAARLHFHQGTKLYNLGRYLDAAKEYEAAYEAKDDPALLSISRRPIAWGAMWPRWRSDPGADFPILA